MDNTYSELFLTRVQVLLGSMILSVFGYICEYLREFLQEDVHRVVRLILILYFRSTWLVACYTLLHAVAPFRESLHFAVHTLTWILMFYRLSVIVGIIWGTCYACRWILLVASQYQLGLVVVIIAVAGIPDVLWALAPVYRVLDGLENDLFTFVRWMHSFFAVRYNVYGKVKSEPTVVKGPDGPTQVQTPTKQGRQTNLEVPTKAYNSTDQGSQTDLDCPEYAVQEGVDLLKAFEHPDLGTQTDLEDPTKVHTTIDQGTQADLECPKCVIQGRLNWLRDAQQNFPSYDSKDQMDVSKNIRKKILSRIKMLGPATPHWQTLKEALASIERVGSLAKKIPLPLMEPDYGGMREKIRYAKEYLYDARAWEALRELRMAYELRRLDTFDQDNFEEGDQVSWEQLNWINKKHPELQFIRWDATALLNDVEDPDPTQRSWQKNREIMEIIEIHELREPLEGLRCNEQFAMAKAQQHIQGGVEDSSQDSAR